MKAVEEPACLSVGTDVSAKYRGAFCEAKIKTVKRLVKVKVNLKAEGTSQVVHDDQVKGQLRVGSVVEVKTSEGGSSEAVISKLTDASLYTVVFDDGDEKTLRRTSLCLKGERHFAESETLDQLPLTNPEHFGTPVIGKKSNRGRRSSPAVADEENESSSSDEEEEERRVSDELLGKVCSLDGPEPSVVLVVSPGCNEELVVKKDLCLVRSFGDGKFSTVQRRNLTTLSCSWTPELSDCKGADSAQTFLRSAEVPEVWKMDLSQILESSSDSDDKHSEEEQEPDEELKKKTTTESEPEEESDPEERDHFLQQLYKFMEDRGTPINKPPVLGYKDLNLFKLFRLVTQHGGYSGIESGTVWKQIYIDLGIPVLNSAAAYNVKTAYRKYLCGFEEFCRSALITFRTIHHNEPRPPASPTNQRPAPETKTGSPANHRAAAEQKDSPSPNQRAAGADLKDAIKMEPEAESESDSETEEHLTSPRGRRRCVLPLKDELRDSRKRMPRQNDQSERTLRLADQSERGGRLADQSERGGRLADQSERGGRLTDQSERGSEDEEDDDEEDDEERLLNPTERGDSDPDADSLAGTRVRVKYGRGKTQKIYEAHIKKTDIDNGENFYLVHYFGWNVRYDEWVKGDRIIWPSEKGKKKRRGKLKNKDEPEGEEERPLKEELPPKGPGRRGRPLGSKNKPNGRPTERPGLGLSLANGDNTPRRRTRRTSGMFDSDRASNEDSGNSSDDGESEDSTEKKPFPWRQAEGGPPGEEEEEPSETTPPSETTAPSMHQEPSQSQQRAEPEAAAAAERKDTAPSETPPKLKLPLVLPPRSEPMVLLHHCLPPDSDTDSASESDSEREEAAGERAAGDATVKTEEQRPEEEKTTEEERGTSPEKKSPLRAVNLRSPNALRTPPREKPQSEKRASESEVMKSPPPQTPQDKVHKETPQEEPSPKPEENQPQNTPHGETSDDRTPSTSNDDRTPSTSNDDRTPSTSNEKTPSISNSTSNERTLSISNDGTPSISNEKTPSTHGSITPQNSPRRGDRTLPENSPKRDRIQLENSPKRSDRIQLENSPKRSDRIQLENSPKRSDRIQLGNSPKRDRVKPENSPRRDKVQLENSPKRQMEMSPRRSDRIQMENSPRRGDGEEQSAAAAERSEDNATPLKRKALEQKTPDKKLKTEPEMCKTTNMAAAEEESPLEEPSAKAEGAVGGEKTTAGGAKAAEAEHVPEMGADALVCHEVDLDEPDEREKVSASEQLMLMRESHLLRAPPTATKAPPPQENCGETQRGGARHEESNGDRGQKRVLEGPHSPTVKKHKRPSHKRLTPNKPDKNGAGLSSDSEDQSQKHCPSPTSRGHKWTLHIDDLEKMSSSERISFLQEKLQEIRKYYLSLKSEVASIDRRRKRLKKKEREVSNTASASSSSDAAMSPSSSSPSQSSLAVEVR